MNVTHQSPSAQPMIVPTQIPLQPLQRDRPDFPTAKSEPLLQPMQSIQPMQKPNMVPTTVGEYRLHCQVLEMLSSASILMHVTNHPHC
jgi:hypothetical protein